MAKAKQPSATAMFRKHVSRPGVHAKTKTSKSKRSRNYKKAYKGQGR